MNSSSASGTARASAEPTEERDDTASPPAGLSGLIAYASANDPQVHLLDLATGETVQLTQLRPEHAEPTGQDPLAPVLSCGFGIYSLAWSPSAAHLAFAYGGCEPVVYILDLDATLARVGPGSSPAWSPDGSRLVFGPVSPCFVASPDCGDPPHPGAWNLQVVDIVRGADPRPLTEDEATLHAGQPQWSPDGSLIAFTGAIPNPDAHPGLFRATYVIGADGSDPRPVAHGAWPAGWLPDGRLLLVDEQTSVLRALDLATADAVRLGGNADPGSAAPDGSRLFLKANDPLTGASEVQLTTLDGDVLAKRAGQSAAWAPDSRAVVIADPHDAGGFVILDRDGALLGTFAIPGLDFATALAWRPGT